MAQHHHQRHAKRGHRIFKAADRRRVGKVASIADDEDLAEAGMEQQFGAGAAVGAGQDRGKRRLTRGERGPARRIRRTRRHLAGAEACIALHQRRQRLIRRQRRAGHVRGARRWGGQGGRSKRSRGKKAAPAGLRESAG